MSGERGRESSFFFFRPDDRRPIELLALSFFFTHLFFFSTPAQTKQKQNKKLPKAKSGMGKTAVFVLSVLQQLDPVDGEVGAIVICHTRELAYQICHEFERFSVYLPGERERDGER